jgi:hypothetical protein
MAAGSVSEESYVLLLTEFYVTLTGDSHHAARRCLLCGPHIFFFDNLTLYDEMNLRVPDNQNTRVVNVIGV